MRRSAAVLLAAVAVLLLAGAGTALAINTISESDLHPIDAGDAFGKLNVHSEGVNGESLDSSVYVYNQSTGAYVSSGGTGSDGVISFYLAPGNYKQG